MLQTLLISAGALALGVGVAHSWLGERYILIRLFRRDNLPRLFGSDWFTKRTLRFAWHLTSVAWWGFGTVLILPAVTADQGLLPERTLQVVALTFFASAVLSLSFAKGRHLSWLLFLAVAVLSWLGAGLMTPSELPASESPSLVDAEVAAIRRADLAYATAWLGNSAQEVMATLTQDAVLVPSGLPPLEGASDIRSFWWPPDSPATKVTEFSLVQHEVGGSGDIGIARGSFTLSFEYDGAAYSSRGSYLSLLRRQADSTWRISRRMWNDHRD